MIRFRNFMRLTVAALVCAAILGPTSRAQAGFTVAVYDDNNLQSTIALTPVSNQLVFFGGLTDHFDLTSGQGSSNFPGLQTGASLNQNSSAQVSTGANFFTGGNTHKITIVISESGYTLPVGTPMSISSSSGGSFLSTGGVVTLATTNQSFLDTSGAAYVPGAVYAAPGGVGTGVATGSNSTTSTLPMNFLQDTVGANNIPGATPFTITNVITLTFTLDSGGSGQGGLSSSTLVTVPAPAGLVLALTGVPCLGLVSRFRRRRTA